jgi:N4-gp56 family major capsid protein
MANSVTISNLRAELWRKQLFADVQDELYMQKFIGTSDTSMIQELTDLSAQPGYKITFGLGFKLSGSGVTGDGELEGNEEAMSDAYETINIDQLRHAVRLTGKMDEKQSAYKMRVSAKDRLKIWWAERIDKEILDKLCGKTSSTFANTPDAPAATRSIWATNRGADGSLVAGDVLDTKCIDAAKQMAMLASPKVAPLRVGGKDHYVMIVHPYQATDLKKDSVWNQAQREANVRGEANPIFSGALGMWNNVIIHEHEYVYAWAGGSGSAPICRAVLCGQQAAVIAYGADVKWVEKQFDYDNKWGVSVGAIFGVVKPMFSSKDYGVITVATAGTTASTA